MYKVEFIFKDINLQTEEFWLRFMVKDYCLFEVNF